MSNVRFYQFVILGLIACNLVLLGFFIFQPKGGKHPHQRPKHIIIERLNFSPNQVKEYEKLILVHKKKVDEQIVLVENLKKKLYSNLPNSQQDTAFIDSLLSKLNHTKGNVERINYEHFLEIKSLCEPNQLPKFASLCADLADIFEPGPRRRPERRPK